MTNSSLISVIYLTIDNGRKIWLICSKISEWLNIDPLSLLPAFSFRHFPYHPCLLEIWHQPHLLPQEIDFSKTIYIFMTELEK